jgi:hypothetical protein
MATRNNSDRIKLAPLVRETSTEKGYTALLVEVERIQSAQYEVQRAVNRTLLDAKVQPLAAQVGCLYNLIILQRWKDIARTLAEKLKDQLPSPKAIARLLENI